MEIVLDIRHSIELKDHGQYQVRYQQRTCPGQPNHLKTFQTRIYLFLWNQIEDLQVHHFHRGLLSNQLSLEQVLLSARQNQNLKSGFNTVIRPRRISFDFSISREYI